MYSVSCNFNNISKYIEGNVIGLLTLLHQIYKTIEIKFCTFTAVSGTQSMTSNMAHGVFCLHEFSGGTS